MQSSMVMMMVGMMMMMIMSHVGVATARVVVDPALLTWVLDQTSNSGWTVREWRDHYGQYDDASWAEWYSSYTIGGRQWQPEEWLEHWTLEENQYEHPLEAVLVELGETVLLQILRGAYRLFRRSRRHAGQRFSPY